jgi:hypothetical protein
MLNVKIAFVALALATLFAGVMMALTTESRLAERAQGRQVSIDFGFGGKTYVLQGVPYN